MRAVMGVEGIAARRGEQPNPLETPNRGAQLIFIAVGLSRSKANAGAMCPRCEHRSQPAG